MTIKRPRLVSLLSSMALAALCLTPAACNLFAAGGAITQKLYGNMPVDPVYVLTNEPLVVLVENYRNPVGSSADAMMVTRFINEDLKENLKPEKDKPPKITLIDYAELLELENGAPSEFSKMKIAEVGRRLGAKQVLYVDLMVSGVDQTPGSEMLRGVFNARVKVVDAATGQSRWPNDMAGGYAVGWESKPQRPSKDVYPAAVRERALRIGSHYIARLFYKWKPEDSPDDSTLQAGQD
jgi:hypothetical protein